MHVHLMENRRAEGWATFGGYWPRGSVRKDSFILKDEAGTPVQVQSEAAARWPDGSVKWSRHIARADQLGAGGELAPGEAEEPGRLSATETEKGWEVRGGEFRITVPKAGNGIATDFYRQDREVFSRAYPVLALSHVREEEDRITTWSRNPEAEIRERAAETVGPLETVFRFDGVFHEDGKEKMPFRIRMYVRADGEILIDDTFFFQGDAEEDRLAGWGLRFETGFKGRPYQRHIRMLTDGAVFHDNPTQLFYWKKHLDPELLAAQSRGETVEAAEWLDEIAGDLPRWDHYMFCQDSASHFRIRKKAWEGGCWLDGVHGKRAPGSMALSDPERTLSFHMRECWEKHPAGMEVRNLSGETTECTVWFYSPQAEPFDFRHYDRRTYPMGNYEGFDYMMPDPNGIAVTCRVAVWSENAYTTDDKLKSLSETVRRPPVYLAQPEYYHDHRAFGFWSLPKRGTEVEKWIEGQMEAAFSFYEAEVEARSWYGLFNYGDFMHTYEACRHMWRWDVGGYAWDNTELTPTYWLWLYFMRTGSERVFRLAEALSRHTADVDMYHFGRMKGLGSRHNVRHWGCPCKEPRVSMAGHHRPLFYLAGERRIGDCMADSLGAAGSLRETPWFRREDGSVRLRSGPDWAALVSDWMTAYERTLDPEWKERIETGVADLGGTPLGLTSGPEFGFDPETGHLKYEGETPDSGMHLQACMGETEVWLETAEMLELTALADMTARNGRFFHLSPEERAEQSGGLLRDRQFGSPIYSAEMQAWAAAREGNGAMARSVWRDLISLLYRPEKPEGFRAAAYATGDHGRNLTEIPWITTNFTSQWCLKTIVCADLISGSMPETFEELNRQMAEHPPEYRLYGA